MLSLLVLAALAAEPVTEPAGAYERSTKWNEMNTVDGVSLARREIPGNFYWEYRSTTVTDVSIDALCETNFDWGSKSKDHSNISLRKLVRDGENERVTYDQISAPIVSGRDLAMLVRRMREPDGTCRIRFFAHNSEAPPKPESFVRIENLWGQWLFKARTDGKVDVIYTMFADPAGSVPPFMVHPTQGEQVRDTVKKGVAMARAFEKKSKVVATPPPAAP